MNSKAIVLILILVIAIIALLFVALIFPHSDHSITQTHADNKSTSSPEEPNISLMEYMTERRAIFIDRKDLNERLKVPQFAILKVRDKIYAVGGGVAVILSEDLRPLCYMNLKYDIWWIKSYDEDHFLSLGQWNYPNKTRGIAMFDSKFNLIWSVVDGNTTDLSVANGKIYAIELKGDYYYVDIFDGNGNLIRSFKVLDLKEVFNVEEIPEEVKDSAEISIEVRGDKIYVAYTTWHYVSGGVAGPFKTILSRFDEEGNLEIKKVIYETEKPEVVNSILSYKDEFILAISSSACRYLFIDEDGDILGEARWKPPFGEGCGAGAKVFDDRVYILGWDPNIFAGFVGFIDDSVYADVSSLYYTEAQVIFVKKDSVWQDNSVVRDILLDDDKLYVIGLVQMDKPSGAFIVRLNPYLGADISTLLERADVVYLEDIPSCKP